MWCRNIRSNDIRAKCVYQINVFILDLSIVGLCMCFKTKNKPLFKLHLNRTKFKQIPFVQATYDQMPLEQMIPESVSVIPCVK